MSVPLILTTTTCFASTLYPSDHTLLHHTICWNSSSLLPCPRTTPFVRTLHQSDQTLLPHPHKNHTLCWYTILLTTPYYHIPRGTTPFAGTLHPYYPIPRTSPFAVTLNPYSSTHYPISRRTIPFASTLNPSDHTVCRYPLSH